MIKKHVKKILNITSNQENTNIKDIPFLFIRMAKIKRIVIVNARESRGKYSFCKLQCRGQMFQSNSLKLKLCLLIKKIH